MSELKTKVSQASVDDFVARLEPVARRDEASRLVKIFREVTGFEPKLWGRDIIGFGTYHYKSDRSRQEGDWPLTGFSARKQTLSLYLMSGCKNHQALLDEIGPHKTGVSCLYLRRLSDANEDVLRQVITESVEKMKQQYPYHS